ncbi:hypothetical protein ACFULT_21965 [Rhodococcus sp. NPDC057297]|uniref:hypothetical protein n=1 Tax=Rhodococcus sp. NPDC057297 TaxID=3346090 RepID=UPI00363D4B78
MTGFIGLLIVTALGFLSFVAIARCEWTKTGSVTTDTRKTLSTSGLGLVVLVPIALGFEVLL